MKYSFMLITPCLLVSHISANASTYARNDSLAQQQYMQQNDYHAERWFPEPVFNGEPRYLKLLQIIDQQQQIKTIKANLSRQSLLIPAVLKS
jgi:hypothetical protein